MTPEESHQRIGVVHAPIYKIVLHLVQENEFGSDESIMLFGIRDSLNYRARAVVYHLHAIQANLEYANQVLQEDLQAKLAQREIPDFHEITTSTTEALLFLLDDLIFSAASYFDYLAKLFFYLLSKQHRMHDDWKRLKSEIKRGAFGERDTFTNAILSENERFIRSLHTHRSNLIHNEKDNSKPQETFHWTPGAFNRRLKPSTPVFFSEQFPDFVKTVPTESQNLVTAAEWLTNEFFKSISKLIANMPSGTSTKVTQKT